MISLRSWNRRLAVRRTLLKRAQRRHDVAAIRKRQVQIRQAEAAIDHLRAHPTMRARAWNAMMALNGVMETGHNSGPVVDKIIHANGGVIGEAWCGDTVAWCYRHAGSKAVTRAWASVPLLGRIAGVKRIKNPERGDIVRFDWNSDRVGDHTGLFDRWIDRSRGIFKTMEGNSATRGGQGVGPHTRSMSEVLSFNRVLR